KKAIRDLDSLIVLCFIDPLYLKREIIRSFSRFGMIFGIFISFFNNFLIRFNIIDSFFQALRKFLEIFFVQEDFVFNKYTIFKTFLAFRNGNIIVIGTCSFYIEKIGPFPGSYLF